MSDSLSDAAFKAVWNGEIIMKNHTATYELDLTMEEYDELTDMLLDQVNYWINESNCADEYVGHIRSGILMLRVLGLHEAADDFERAFENVMACIEKDA